MADAEKIIGDVEKGVRYDLRKFGVRTPKTALQHLAIRLARLLDSTDVDLSKIPNISHELRMTIAAIAKQPGGEQDPVSQVIASAAKKQPNG